MPSIVSSSSTSACARDQSPFASHHKAASGADSIVGGDSFAHDALNSSEFILAFVSGIGTGAANSKRSSATAPELAKRPAPQTCDPWSRVGQSKLRGLRYVAALGRWRV